MDRTKEREKWLQDIRWVLSTPQGRRFYWGLMARCKAFKAEFVESTNLTYYRQGQRSVGVGMLDDLMDADAEKYLQMVQENSAKETREDIKRDRDVKEKLRNPTRISSPVLPNTGAEMSAGGK